MDPNLIHLDWERASEGLMLVVLFAFLLERALAVVFESKWYIERFDREGQKELIAAAAAIAMCWHWKLDVIGMLMLTETTTAWGYLVTGLVVAGGSKASLRLFHDVMKIRSDAYEGRHDIQASAALRQVEEAVQQVEAAERDTDIADARKKGERAADRAEELASRGLTTRTMDVMGSAQYLRAKLEDTVRRHTSAPRDPEAPPA